MSTVIRSLVFTPAHLFRHLGADPLAGAIEMSARDGKPFVLVVLGRHGFEILLLGGRKRSRRSRFGFVALLDVRQPVSEKLENWVSEYLQIALLAHLPTFDLDLLGHVLGFPLLAYGFPFFGLLLFLFVVAASSKTADQLSLDFLIANFGLGLGVMSIAESNQDRLPALVAIFHLKEELVVFVGPCIG
jgi:hypothetical protein